MSEDLWPPLPYAEWRDTAATLHMWTQIVGKVRLAASPPVNHWWGAALQVTARGLTTGPSWWRGRTFQIDFDFVDHVLVIADPSGRREVLPLRAESVADFYERFQAALHRRDLQPPLWPHPVEVVESIPFADDVVHRDYDGAAAQRFHRVLLQADRVMSAFRARFVGKASPVHFFWGSFDLATSRFSGRPAPPHPGGAPHVADWVVREAYSHEVSSAGFWPGGGPVEDAAFYSYVYPEPEGFALARLRPDAAYYSKELREMILPYAELRRARDIDATLLRFLQSTYEAAAELGDWDRLALERHEAKGTEPSAPGLSAGAGPA